MMKQVTIVTFIITLILTTPVTAITMQELFDSVNAEGNVNNPAILQGQTMNLYSGGSLFMRMPDRSYNLASVTPPSWNAGCGGIDLYTGGFSYINKDQFVAMLRNIGANSLGYAFKLAIQNLCPTCDNVMQALQATANIINRQNIDSCETALGVVNASVPDTWTRGKQNAAKNYGVDMNIFADLTDAWTSVMNNESQANNTINQAANARPEARNTLPSGNVTWKALKSINGLTDEYRMVLMSIVGSMIFPTGDIPEDPKPLTPKPITVETLVGLRTEDPNISLPIWRCDTIEPEGCLNPDPDGILETLSFKAMVHERMQQIADTIADRGEYNNLDDIIAFINATDIPVYKILAVSTRYGDTTLAEAVINKYEELIAAKYAEVYIQRAVSDLRASLALFSTTADASQTEVLNQLKPEMERVVREAKQVVSLAHSQTVSTFAIIQEVQHMERAMNRNLSQTLRSSLAFAKSLQR